MKSSVRSSDDIESHVNNTVEPGPAPKPAPIKSSLAKGKQVIKDEKDSDTNKSVACYHTNYI